MWETERKWEAGRKLKRAEGDRQKKVENGNKDWLIGTGRTLARRGGY